MAGLLFGKLALVTGRMTKWLDQILTLHDLEIHILNWYEPLNNHVKLFPNFLGAGSGIGRATSRILAREGATVIVSDRKLEGAEETVKFIGGLYQCLTIQICSLIYP